ncbi:p25-alpha domain containing protein [Paragonimus heterotremus]|uniref:p25-alpha domain containing protein n=1 Tax=Paragonimus heterotremus TaxID=100268 RepID=A0A8J4WLX2_9TREM|nr:p25-alpha domain containing protein [Paragonimus heterotremus]
MAEGNGDLRAAFLAYCSFISHDSSKGNSSTIRKMCTDTGINKTKMKQNDIDLEYSRCFGTSKEQIDYKAFLHFVTDYLGPVYGKMNGIEREQAVAEVKDKLSKATPQLRNTTKPSKDALTQRLVDPNLYPQPYRDKVSTETKRPAYNPAPGRQLSKK